MRRTRHVVLPVKSWQYIGLLVVSLACLTLGLVSRDREGKSGSLAGFDLKHNAPHEVDACPNKFPFILKPVTDPILNEKSAETDINPQTDQLNENTEGKSVSSTRKIIASEQKMMNYRTRDSINIRTTLENRRLTRFADRSTRNSRIRSQSVQKRSISLDRRISDTVRTRESSNRRENEASRLQERRARDLRSSERQNRENRLINTRRLSSRSLDRVSEKVTVDRLARSARESRDRRSAERRESRINISERQEQSRSRFSPQRSSESRLLARSRLERTTDRSRDRRSVERRENRNLERRERQVERFSRLNNRQQEQRSTERRDRRSLERSPVSNANERTWVDSLRRSTRSISLDINRNRNRQVSRDISRDRRMTTANGRQSRLENRVDERTRRLNERKTNYLLSMPKLSSANQTTDIGKNELLRQTFVLTLCAIYTASLVQGKNGFLRNILNQVNRFSLW